MISVEGLGKRYRIRRAGDRPRYAALRDVIAAACTTPLRRLRGTNGAPAVAPVSEDFWALRDVSFEVARGEVLGIIGRNGAGKSTLLKILSRISEPTRGRVTLRGRVASLLEVGTGFHAELTGRENIFLNGAVLGMTRAETRAKLDAIVAFAEVEPFLDTPVKWYSSGMYVRLAFAVAAHLEPEILVVDEVLAVGDSAFQQKCLAKMDGIARAEGRTVLLVSHNMQTIRQLCPRAILLVGGHTAMDGESSRVIQHYLQSASTGLALSELARVIEKLPPDPVFRLRHIDVVQDGRSGTEVLSGRPLEIVVEYDVVQAAAGLHVWISFSDVDGTLLFDSLHNGDAEDIPTVATGAYRSRATIPADFLAGRTYDLAINVAIHNVRECIPQPTPLRLPIHVTAVGRVNRGYPGWVTRGKLAPLIAWETSRS
jgi:lipopolysaccharide transport system ATP-binding protein